MDENNSLIADREEKHWVNLRIEVSEVPDLKKVTTIASKIGVVKSVSYDSY